MSAREYIVPFHAPFVYRYNKEKFVRRKMYSLALVKIRDVISIEIVILHGVKLS